MRQIGSTALAVAVMSAQLLSAQTQAPLNPAAPGTPGAPAWQATLQLSDGRTFVTDGGLAMDAAIARPSTLPERKVPAKIIEDYINVVHTEECRLGDLTAGVTGRTYTTPSGLPLSATYIDFLRRQLPAASVRLRMTGPLQPVVVAADGKAIAVLMPVAR
jgi:hypothetical protein